MKNLILSITFTCLCFFATAQTRTASIYSNKLTHTTITAELTFENNVLVRSKAALAEYYTNIWSEGENSIVYSGSIAELKGFLSSIQKFAAENKDVKTASTEIEGRKVDIKRIMGVKCISITSGNTAINTNIESISEAMTALNKY